MIFKNFLILSLFIVIPTKLASMEANAEFNDELLENHDLINSKFEEMPTEITEMILKETLKASIKDLQLPISENNFLEEPDETKLPNFVQNYSSIIQKARLINRRCNSILLNLKFYLMYLLILKLNQLTIDQKFNALLCFIKLQNPIFITASLLSFLNISNLTLKDIHSKYQLLKKSLMDRTIICNKFNPDTKDYMILKIMQPKTISSELLELLIAIRSMIPLFYNPRLYFDTKLKGQRKLKALSPLEREYHIFQTMYKSDKIRGELDLFDIDAFFFHHTLIKYEYNVPILKQLTNIYKPYSHDSNFYGSASASMKAALNGNLEMVEYIL